MKIRNLLRAVSLGLGLAAILLAGCGPMEQPKPASVAANPDTPGIVDDTRSAAEAALGKQAEVLAHGDLAHNEMEQLLIVNRFGGTSRSAADLKNPAAIYVTRAAILQKQNNRWTEVLLCDEYLKNPFGYLGGSPAERVSGWRLEFNPDMPEGLEMKFTPAHIEADGQESGGDGQAGQPVVVRWNKSMKRYQSLDASHERYLSEAPTLETPHSTLQ